VFINTKNILTRGIVVALLLSCVAAVLAANLIMNEGFDSTDRTGNGQDENNQIPVPEFPILAFPVAFIVGMTGVILWLQKTREQ
jgi:hypothetical protein